jgi:predicted secreted protein
MAIATVVAIYFVVWWTLLFTVLPFGVRSQAESGEVVPGTDPGAPAAPGLLRKALWTSLVAAVATAGIVTFGDRLLDP